MSDIISQKVTKFQQPLLITLGVTDEKPEGAQKAPPPPPPKEDRVNSNGHLRQFFSVSKYMCNRT